MVKTFFDILSRGLRQGQVPAKTKAAIKWYQGQASQVQKMNRSEFIKNQSNQRAAKTVRRQLEIGSMYIYNYDPKLKATLPVYDTHPVIFCINIHKDRFLGINLHYLPHKERAELMDILHGIKNNDRYDDSTKLKISYQVLKKIAKKKLYAPTIHLYLKKHVKSRLMYVYPLEWDQAIFLPIAKFNGPQAGNYAGH
jgi:hypothetical protein